MVKPKTGLARQGLEIYVKGLSHYIVLCISIQFNRTSPIYFPIWKVQGG